MKPQRLAFALPFLLVLAGCSILGSEQRDPVTIYAPDVRIAPQAGWPQVDWTLIIAKPTAARVIDSPRISVRPMPGELQVYRGASWAKTPTDMLQDTVLDFVEIEPGVEGLVHITEMSWTKRITKPSELLKVGQQFLLQGGLADHCQQGA